MPLFHRLCVRDSQSPLSLAGGLFVLIALVTALPESALAQRDDRVGVDPVVAKINALIQQSWTDNEIAPSDKASDAEWLRRVYLDVIGDIPPENVVNEFVKDKDAGKRARVVDQLLADRAYVRHWSTIWTNNCIGRGNMDRVDRPAMAKFFREAFGRNRPWNEIVVDLITAEGDHKEKGEVNFILAQGIPEWDRRPTDNDAVQLTAKVARLLLGVQVQCTQCHNHPFNDWKQDQFWQLNAFLPTDGLAHRNPIQ